MNLPNKLTLSRIIMIPVFVLFFYLDVVPYHEIIAAAVFALAAFTDFLDGYIARKYHLVTNMGKFLDPIADKVLVSTAFILLLTRPLIFGYNSLAGWGPIVAGICVALIMARELIVSGFRLVAVERGLVLAADKLGKIKTTVQDITIVVVLCVMPFLRQGGDVIGYEEGGAIAGMALLLLATLLTVLSGANYLVKNRAVLRTDEAPQAPEGAAAGEENAQKTAEEPKESGGEGETDVPEPYLRALRLSVKLGQTSISLIQRKCAVGYYHAGKIIEWMENRGYITPFDGKAKGRTVLLTKEEYERLYGPLD